MIIRSQDRKSIINYSCIDKIYIRETDIWIRIIARDNIERIAAYSTEEKAIKVLDMIEDACRNMAFTDGVVFQMPQDSEV